MKINNFLGYYSTTGGGGQEQNPYINSPFGIKALSTGSTNIKFAKSGSPDPITLYYKINDGSWTSYTIGNNITLAKDQICYFSGNNDHFSKDDKNIYKLSASNYIEAVGNNISLTNEGNEQEYHQGDFYNLFSGCTKLKDASKLVLSIPKYRNVGYYFYGMFKGCTSLTAAPEFLENSLNYAYYCCNYMFSDCTSLVTPPSFLPYIDLYDYCYEGMFWNCTSLTSAPQLPASTLTNNCYMYMFYKCTSLTAAPALPATTLTIACYYSMFSGCTNITSAKIDATNVENYDCMSNMFAGCSKLSSIEVNFTDWCEYYNATYGWVAGVANTGQFICPAALPHDSSYFNADHIPPGWTVITK